MSRLAPFASGSFPFFVVLAVAACGDDSAQTTSPIGVACAPARCGDVPDHGCPNGEDSPIECLRGEDGACAWKAGDCLDTPSAGRSGASVGTAGEAGRGGSSATDASAEPPAAGSGGRSSGSGGAAADSGGNPGGGTDGTAGPRPGAGGAAGRGGVAGVAGPPLAGMGGPPAGGPPAGRGGPPGPGAGTPGPGGGVRCGTRGGVDCGEDQFCKRDGDPECGATDRGGVCEDLPQDCSQVFEPVCGCDEHTHPNACMAHSTGISVKREGLCREDECNAAGGHFVRDDGSGGPPCAPGDESWPVEGGICCAAQSGGSGQTCGGIAALECSGDEFCNFEESAGGQGCDGSIADAGGVCEVRPMGCTREFNPVCSCRRRSFNNTCLAHTEGESILHDGGCTEDDCDAVGGQVVFGTGPAPMCPQDSRQHTFIVEADGMSIEGAICCVP